MNKSTFFIDIDQTVSTGHVSRDLSESVQWYRDLGLEIPDGIQSWPALFTLPEVARRHEVLPGALIGCWCVSGAGELFYATARKPDVEQITRDWLYTQAFPRPEQVIFVPGVSEKLLAIAKHPGPLVLIDDRWHQLLGILEEYGEHRVLRDLHQRLTLVAFGASAGDVPALSVVPIVPLSDWSGIRELLQSELFTASVSRVESTRKDVL